MTPATRKAARPRRPQPVHGLSHPAGPGAPPRRREAAQRARYVTLNGATMVTIAAVALSAIGLLYLIQTAHVASLGYDLSRIEQQRDELAIANARLGYEIASYESLDTIQQVAVQRLGMTPMTRYHFLRVEMPRQAQLVAPAPAPAPVETLWARVERALTGVGRAQAPQRGTPALPADWEGN